MQCNDFSVIKNSCKFNSIHTHFILTKCYFSMAVLLPETGSNVASFGYRKATQKGVREIHT